MHTSIEHDPYLKPNTSTRNRVARALWGLVYMLFFRPSPRPMYAWRAWLLRLFGAKLGPNTRIYPSARIWAPWNLECEELAAIGEQAIIYNPTTCRLGSHSIVSEQAYLCGATHDYRDPAFPMIWAPIVVERYAWVCTRACVQMGVIVGEGAILGLNAVATSHLEPWTVYAGSPARKIQLRPRPLNLSSGRT